jgi:hypothetical protein
LPLDIGSLTADSSGLLQRCCPGFGSEHRWRWHLIIVPPQSRPVRSDALWITKPW